MKTIEADRLEVPLEIYRGDTFNVLILTAADEDGQGGLEPVDLSGYEFALQFRPAAQAEIIFLELGQANFVLGKSDPQQSEFDELYINLSPQVTADLPVGTWQYDLELTDAGGEVNTPIFGPVTIIADVTRE